MFIESSYGTCTCNLPERSERKGESRSDVPSLAFVPGTTIPTLDVFQYVREIGKCRPTNKLTFIFLGLMEGCP